MAKRIPATVSDDLYEAAEILRKRRRYRNKSEYVQGLIRYDAQTQRDHHLTAEWAALSPHERDRMDAALLRQVQSGEGIKGSWLEHRIEDIVKRHMEKGEAPTVKQVAGELAQTIIEQTSR